MTYQRISSHQAKHIIDTGLSTVIDIRDKNSFDLGHIDTAIHIDKSNLEAFIASADKTRPLIVCCYHGNLSQGAAAFFDRQEFVETYSLDGGFSDWVKAE